MPTPLALFNAAAGGMGSPYLAVLSFLAKAAGNYVVNDTNFAGIGKFLPCWVVVELFNLNAGTTGGIEISTDNGTTWKRMLNVNGTATAGTVINGGLTLFCDTPGVTGVGQGVSTTATIRVALIGNVADVFLFPLLNA
jgi:hypothetical protein